jgi:hypothetical protein
MIDAAWWAWRRLRRVPADVWTFVVLALVSVALMTWSEARRGAAYRQGKRDAAAGVVFDSVLLERAALRVAQQLAHTDTVTVVVTRTQREVTTVLEALPDSLKAIPDVARLVAVTTRLVHEVDSLKAAHVRERAAWTEKARVDSAALYALRVIATAKGDTVQMLKKRPTWKHVVGTAVTVGALAFLGGRV